MKREIPLALLAVFFALCGDIRGGDWPAYNHDNRRSCVTNEQLKPPLRESWIFKATYAPQPAWPAPAKQDYWHRLFDLRSTVTYDSAFGVVGAGDTIYFGSSADDKVYALDALSGRVLWTFFTDGPVRLAPVVSGKKLYVGSDDGCVYCLSTADGSLIWKYKVSEQNRIIPGNGRLISHLPIRAGLVANAGTIYFAAGLFPNQGAWLIALNAEDGSEKWKQQLGISPQGYMLASDDRLYVPTGRTSPAIFDSSTGKSLGSLSSAGGAYALLTEDVLVTGPGRGAKQITANDAKTRDKIATFGGLRMLVHNDIAYMQSESKLTAFDRTRFLNLSREKNALSRQFDQFKKQLEKLDKTTPAAQELQGKMGVIRARLAETATGLKKCYLWEVDCEYPYSMILAGEYLFTGGENKVAAFSAGDGAKIWSAPVAGKARSLSAMNGGLYVSTDKGQIHLFRGDAKGESKVISPQIQTNPYPKDDLTELYASAAEYIVKQAGTGKGYCLVLGSGEGRLAYELARRTELKIIGVEKDARKVAAARQALDKAGLYGRVVILQGSVSELSFTSFFANLIVCDEGMLGGKVASSAEEVFRLLRPYGGYIALGGPAEKSGKNKLKKWGRGIPGWTVEQSGKIVWGIARRGKLEGAGEWTHTYAEPGNTACSQDELIKGKVAMQWFGRPGPEQMIDRHHRNVPPLFKDGRLFVPGDCVVFAVDAYNGTNLWDISIPNSRRLGVFLDSGSMVVDEQLLYVVAEDKCYGFDVRTGKRSLTHTMPQLIEGEPRHWGYIAYSGDLLFASGRRKDASYTETSYAGDNALWHRSMKVVVSDYLFAMNKKSGSSLWNYKDGLILNTTITVGGGRIYFIETTSPNAMADTVGSMPIKTLFDGGEQYLVALDSKSGKLIYRNQIDVANFEEPVYLSYADNTILLSGSRLIDNSVRYSYYAFYAGTGKIRWNLSHDTGLAKDGGHGEYNRHPTIIDDTVYAWPYAYTLKTGEKIGEWRFNRRGHGCGGVSASAQCMFWRGANPWMYDLGPEGGPERLTSITRPGCWINIIPAGGLVLIPESSSGCTCGFSIQTSMAFIPNRLLNSN